MLTDYPGYDQLQQSQQRLAQAPMADAFQADAQRFQRYSLSHQGLLLDYSKNLIDAEAWEQLLDLAEYSQLSQAIAQLFAGESVNHTEGRPALHMALRGHQPSVQGAEITAQVAEQQASMQRLVTQLQQGQLRGATGKAFRHIVNIGVGGSDLGGVMATLALQPYCSAERQFHFVSTMDGVQIAQLLPTLEPDETLFILASKSFTTADTQSNATVAKAWLSETLGEEAWPQHFIGVSTKAAAMQAYGILPERQLLFWDWVGGRYSMTSAIGLPIAMAVGWEHFTQILAGCAAMDQHFATAPLAQNIPVIMGLLSVWYNNFWQAPGQAILPYDARLQRLPAYLTQLYMESLGKSVDKAGQTLPYHSGWILFGEIGSNAQHSFYQLLHQGTRIIPADFIAVANPSVSDPAQRDLALANCLAQSQVLMTGYTAQQAQQQLLDQGLDLAASQALASHKAHPGNRPTNTLVIDEVTPFQLGQLVALYEHKVFVESVLWQINPFDQWGVELGKVRATQLLPVVQGEREVVAGEFEGSTHGLLTHLLAQRT